MTVPGVNVIPAAVFLAAVGDIRRFNGSRPVVAYLGLDPRVYQSGSGPARSGRISKQGSRRRGGRWSKPPSPSPVSPARCTPSMSASEPQGHNAAVVAVARKLAVMFWCMLGREEDYAHQQPSLTAEKLRGLEVKAGEPTLKGKPTGVRPPRADARSRDSSPRRPRPRQSARSPTGTPRPQQQKAGASVTPGRA